MSQDTNRPNDLEKGGSQETVAGILSAACRCRRKVPTCKVDDHPEQLRPELPQTPQDASNSDESSRKIYSVYSKIAEEEDNKMTESWQKSADGILIFVSPCIDVTTHINRNTIMS
jgi:hypothetical protein